MARIRKTESGSPIERPKPALTQEGRIQQLTSMAFDLVEERFLNKTATSQETTYFLKLASKETDLKLKKLEVENALIEAKKMAIEEEAKERVDYAEVLKAIRRYSGRGSNDAN